MKTCPVCQADLKHEDVKCTVCDTDLRTVLEMDRYLAEAEADLIPVQPEKRRSIKARYILPVLVLFLVAGWFAHELSGRYFTSDSASEGIPHSSEGLKKATNAPGPGINDQSSDAADIPKFEKIREIAPAPENMPQPASILQHARAAELAETSKKLLELVAQIANEVPSGVNVHSSKGGIFIKGAVDYPWQKEELERKARGWKCDFIDFTGLRTKSPHAFLYRIRKGDSLSVLAGKFLGQPSAWAAFYETNREVLSDPNKLEIGQQIVVFTKLPAPRKSD